MGGVEGLVLGAVLVGVEVDAVAGGVAADRELGLALAEPRLVAPVGGVAGALVAGQLDVRAGVAGGVFDSGPEAAGADGLVLARVADGDQPRAGGLDRSQQPDLLAGGRERGLVVDHGAGRGRARSARR